MYKAIDKWLIPYLKSAFHRPRLTGDPVHILFCVCDHFEPLSPFGSKPHHVGVERVARWRTEFPSLANQFTDADGGHPRHSFFYPAEQYHIDFLGPLEELTAAAYGEVEIHLHHRNDTEETLSRQLIEFRDLLHREHGLLGTVPTRGMNGSRLSVNGYSLIEREGRKSEPEGNGEEAAKKHPSLGHCVTESSEPIDNEQRTTHHESRIMSHESRITSHESTKHTPVFAFIHGNWALCNSRPDGDWCGVDHELKILKETGCYADLTFPSIPSPTQPRKFCNQIYLSRDTGRRSHERGRLARAGSPPETDELLMIQGPAALNWRWRKLGVLPRIEHADLCGSNPPTPLRTKLWLNQHIHIQGREDWVFIKLHTHGCIEKNTDVLLGQTMGNLHRFMTSHLNDGHRYALHYVTARELANIAFAAMDGKKGNPGQYRDYRVASPPAAG